MNSVYKRMVFHFYTFENFLENEVIQMHLKCLKEYSYIFDETIIVISMDDVTNNKLAVETKIELIKVLNCPKIVFKIIKNNEYRECETFYNEIVLKLNKLNGLTFFGHNKGTTNVTNSEYNKESVLEWLFGMYYLCLEDYKEKEKKLLNGNYFYGGFLIKNNKIHNKYHIQYQGTFYWINTVALYKDLEINNIEIPILDDRGYAEDFVGNFYGWENYMNIVRVGSPNSFILFNGDPYNYADDEIKSQLKEKYNIFKEKYNNL